MSSASRRRTIQAVALSGAAHAVVLTALALHAPVLTAPPQVAGPPEPIIPVLIVTRLPPPKAGGPPPSPIRLHRRPQAFARHFPVPPLPVPDIKVPQPPPPNSRVTVIPPEPEVTSAELRAVLRTGAAGCANLAALSQAERERCTETLGAGARFAPYQGPGLAADKQQVFDRAAASKEAYQRYKRTTPIPSAPGGDIGTTATDMANALGDTRR